MSSCPNCGQAADKVIYAGFPMRLCGNEECSTVFGFWSCVMEVMPFNGLFFVYRGNYPQALWRWLCEF